MSGEPKTQWTEKQRDAARAFLGEVQPHNAAIIISNIEDMMPKQWRKGFEHPLAFHAMMY